MNILEAAKNRYTTKHYDKSKKISKEDLAELLEILRISPSSVNIQAWHFLVAESESAKEKLLPAVLDFNHPRVEESSCTIVFCIKDVDDAYLDRLVEKQIEDGRLPTKELVEAQRKGLDYFVGLNSHTQEQQNQWAMRQLYIALGNLLLAAAAKGIDSTAIEGCDFDKMSDLLGLKEKGLKPVVIASLGYRAPDDGNATRPKSRFPMEEVVSYL